VVFCLFYSSDSSCSILARLKTLGVKKRFLERKSKESLEDESHSIFNKIDSIYRKSESLWVFFYKGRGSSIERISQNLRTFTPQTQNLLSFS